MYTSLTGVVSAFDTNAYGDGAVHGCDFAGIVEEVGPDVVSLVKGERVAGVIWGGSLLHLLSLNVVTDLPKVTRKVSVLLPSVLLLTSVSVSQ